MKALWLENKQLVLCDIPIPQKSDEVLIKVRLAGICGTDLELIKGYYPYTGILGHEFVGEVVETQYKDWLGQRVVADINVTCGLCEQCLNNRTTHCEQRSVLGIINRDGVFAEYVSLPLKNLHRVPDTVSDEAAVFTEPLAAALAIQQQVQIKPTDRILLVGAGRLGQLIAQTLALTGADVHVLARHALQKQLLAQRHIKLIDETDIEPWRWDVVIEATGSAAGFDIARKAIRPRGTLVLKSTYHGNLQINMSSIVVDEITIVGSRCGAFEPALRLLAQGDVNPIPLIAKRFALTEGIQAFNEATQTGMLKVLIDPLA